MISMRKIVINIRHCGFMLSQKARQRYAELRALDSESSLADHMIPRDDPYLVQVVEDLGKEANGGRYAELKIVEIPDDVKWIIVEDDGAEHIAEVHRTWS